ncbi:response regulator transcription factor [Microbacteriaceae bacterium VKM Ac-2855]|nr:response regulator transcription factor [Microbacteriaceae bacterium VKM Ac-2855]
MSAPLGGVPARPRPADSASLRVVIADDALLLRQGIETVLVSGGCSVVASVGTAEEALAAVASAERSGAPIDTLVLDIRMPPRHSDEGLVALETLRGRGSTVGVLLLSMYATPAYAIRAMAAGRGTGYLLKDRVADVDALVGAVRTVARGGSVVDEDVVAHLVDRRASDDTLGSLSAREREVLTLMAQGKSNLGIATSLFLSGKTVETHIRNILQKLDIEESPADHRRVLAVLRGLGRR